ncbi:unnamed protein product [Trichobilharzia regenti]|nr:unnamed protein product [Trichobilharzia regenti]
MLRQSVPMSLFCLDCKDVNEELANRVWKLRDIIVTFEMDENRDVNRRYVCVCVCIEWIFIYAALFY